MKPVMRVPPNVGFVGGDVSADSPVNIDLRFKVLFELFTRPSYTAYFRDVPSYHSMQAEDSKSTFNVTIGCSWLYGRC